MTADSERAKLTYLTYADEQGQARTFHLDVNAAPVRIGRSDAADIRLRWDTLVSRVHAELVHLGDGWAIVDDGISSNGTRVNGDRIRGRRRLKAGDEIEIGDARLTFRTLADDEDRKTRLADDDHTPIELSVTQRKVLIALCRPYRDGQAYGAPASNQKIADELYLSVDAVKMHLRALFRKLAIGDLPQNQKRGRLVELAFERRLIGREDLEG